MFSFLVIDVAQYDLVIRSGSVIDGTGQQPFTADVVIDGTGQQPFTADVAIKNGKIAATGRVSGHGDREVNADGALVTPGFVDIHTHYDGQATWSNRMSPSSHHGVTSVVMGNCGVGFAPVRPTDHDLLIELMEGVEDIPGVALSEGLSWEWESFPDYLDYLSKRQFDMDICAQLPHAAMRVYVMGQRGADREPATTEDIIEMRRLTEEAIRAGALGFTSSRTLNHRSSKGEPTPTLQAEHDELVGMANALHTIGYGVMEMISDFEDLDTEFELLKSMVGSAGRPMSISLAQGISDHGWRKILNKIEHANDAGYKMRGQVAPRPIGILLGLTTTLSPFTTRPSFTEVAHLPLDERVLAMADPGRKARILAEPTGKGFGTMFRLMDEGRKIWLMTDPPNYEPNPEDSLNAQAIARGLDPWSYIYDVLLQNNGRSLLYTPFANYAQNNLDCCRDMILHKDTVMGLGDGGAHVGTICDASFITSLITHWGRDRVRGEKIDLPTLIKCQSRDTARAVDLTDRGTLEPGMKADVNIIDFENLSVRLPEIVNDLPAGGARLQQRADGYLMTIVNGEPTYIEGEETDSLPGRLVRKTGADSK